MAVACAGFFMDKAAPVIVGFLSTGAFLALVAAIIAVFETRLEGKQSFKMPKGGGVTINLAKINRGEAEIKKGKARRLGRR